MLLCTLFEFDVHSEADGILNARIKTLEGASHALQRGVACQWQPHVVMPRLPVMPRFNKGWAGMNNCCEYGRWTCLPPHTEWLGGVLISSQL